MSAKTDFTLEELVEIRQAWNNYATANTIPSQAYHAVKILGRAVHNRGHARLRLAQVDGEFAYKFDVNEKYAGWDFENLYSWEITVTRHLYTPGIEDEMMGVALIGSPQKDWEKKQDCLMNWTEVVDSHGQVMPGYYKYIAERKAKDNFVIPGDWWKVVAMVGEKADRVKNEAALKDEKVTAAELARTLMIDRVPAEYLKIKKNMENK